MDLIAPGVCDSECDSECDTPYSCGRLSSFYSVNSERQCRVLTVGDSRMILINSCGIQDDLDLELCPWLTEAGYVSQF